MRYSDIANRKVIVPGKPNSITTSKREEIDFFFNEEIPLSQCFIKIGKELEKHTILEIVD